MFTICKLELHPSRKRKLLIFLENEVIFIVIYYMVTNKLTFVDKFSQGKCNKIHSFRIVFFYISCVPDKE